jgi:hypothetical protein
MKKVSVAATFAGGQVLRIQSQCLAGLIDAPQGKQAQ